MKPNKSRLKGRKAETDEGAEQVSSYQQLHPSRMNSPLSNSMIVMAQPSPQ